MLAKLSQPRLFQPVLRERLFRLLDQHQSRSVIWVAGPPGSGKSTLVASYLERRELQAYWYQVDEGDKDPATFFYYLGELAKARKRNHRLPYLIADYAADVPGFTRRYFRQLFELLGDGALLVFDNCQEAASAQFDEILREAFAEIPNGACVIVLSRSEMPATLARLRLTNQLTTIDAQSLSFTLEESRQFILQRSSEDAVWRTDELETEAAQLHHRSGGWVAGLALLIADSRRAPVEPTDTTSASTEALFDYFAGEIFARTPAVDQEIMLRTAVLSQFTARMAIAISGSEEAAGLMERLYRRQYFVTRRRDSETSYQYHDLFREFLLARLEEQKGTQELNLLRQQAAAMLAQHSRAEDAVDLLIASEAFAEAATLIRECASKMVDRGQHQTLVRWLDALPKPLADADPWLHHWRGAALLWFDPAQAQPSLEAAHGGFVIRDAKVGQIMAATLLFDAIEYRLGRLHDKDRWIAALENVLPQAAINQTTLLSWALFLSALLDRQLGHPLLPTAAEVLRQHLYADTVDAALRLRMASVLMYYAAAMAEPSLREFVMPAIKGLPENETIAPSVRCTWFLLSSIFDFATGDWATVARLSDEAISLASYHHLDPLVTFGRTYKVPFTVMLRNYGEAESEIEALAMTTSKELFYAQQFIPKARALLWWIRGDAKRAAQWIDPTVQAADESGLIANQMFLRLDMVPICIDAGDLDKAEQLLRHARAIRAGTRFRWSDAQFEAVEAYLLHRQGRRSESRAKLGEALRLCDNAAMRGSFIVLDYRLPELLSDALAHDVETERARRIIRDFSVPPPEDAAENWPWPVRIRALGSFDVWVNDSPLSMTGRAHYRVLTLLKALIAFGPAPISAERLADLLWPESDGDAAAAALKTTLHRLRKLLEHDEAVRMHDGNLSINNRLCYVDAHRFASRLNGHDTAARDMRELQDSIDMYRGALLPNESSEWIIAPRERLHTAYLKLRDGADPN